MSVSAKFDYKQGLTDGIELTLDQLEAKDAAMAPEGIYDGPMPDELQEWIDRVRKNLAKTIKEDRLRV